MTPLLTRARSRTDRFLQIADVFIRHGLGFLVEGLGAPIAGPLHRVRRTETGERLTQPQHLRMALEELGPTFIKVGQLISTRQDLLPTSYTQELRKLQDDATVVPYEELMDSLAGQPEQTMLEQFDSIDTTPLASGSIGQVHAGVLHGQDVVVKFRKPGVLEEVHQDLDIISDLATLLSRYVPLAKQYDVVELSAEFSRTLLEELNYTIEATHCDRFANFFHDDPELHIPHIYWEATTSRILTQERVGGIKISNVDALDAHGIDRHRLAVNATGAMCRMIFEFGYFHADPHPGNLFVRPDGAINLIDFGMCGELSEDFRDSMLPLLIGVTTQNIKQCSRAVIRLTNSHGRNVTPQEIEADLGRIIRQYSGQSLDDLNIGRVLTDVMALLHRHQLSLPSEAALLIRMIATAESLGELIDPDFDFIAVLKPFATAFVSSRVSVEAILKRLTAMTRETVGFGVEVPSSLRKIMSVIENGGFDVHLRADELEEIIDRVEVVGNRLVAGAVLAALVNGSAKIISTHPEGYRSWKGLLISGGAGGAGLLSGYILSSARLRVKRPKRRRGLMSL
ncbi:MULTISPECIES: ABC1 kinase family protein [Kocuria]|uniref:ABC1 kinase family protein n=1 Tax=Kocuria TaxID=57493 RepID=UPI000AE9D277|nr:MULTISPECIES: AarF/ABC1/UbiB kinase family protein [Kocuria]MCT1366842.1 AarF/ABC1/UbiB kinase family protein [Rothia sp. p3-SID1597]